MVARDARGRDRQGRRTLGLVAAVGVLAALLLAAGLYQMRRQQQEASGWVYQTLEVLDAAAALETDLTTAAGDARAFMLDRRADSIQSFDAAARRTLTDLATLRTLTAADRTQQAALDDLQPLVAGRIAILRDAIGQRRADDSDGVSHSLPSQAWDRLLDRTFAVVAAMKSQQRRLLDQRSEAALHAARLTLGGLIACGIILAASGLLATMLRITGQREHEHLVDLRALNAGLEARVKARTAELAASQVRQHAYFYCLADGLLAIRVERGGGFVIEQVNAAAQAMLGLDERAIGRQFHEMWPQARSASLEERLRQCAAAGQLIHFSDLHATAEGDRELRFTLTPVAEIAGSEHPEGRIALVLASIRDVTHEVVLEAQLRTAQRMEAVGRLSAGVAHDFNNLLQAQMASLELLEDAIAADDKVAAIEYAATALRMGERGAYLTHHLLSFSRQQILRPCPVAIDDLLIKAATVLGSALGPSIRVEIDIDPDTGSALVDQSLLETALLNLAFNARDAMPRGGRLHIEAYASTVTAPSGATETLAAGRYVVLAVDDRGTGMTPETLARAVEPFFTTKGVKGSGLGLAMVHGFSRQSGGDTRIQSKLGDGTRVEIWLPAVASPAVAATPPQSAGPHRAGRALVVDDAPDVLVMVGAFLEAAAFEVTEVRSGEAALALLSTGQRFDVMVTDYAMPGINGAELITAARELCPTLPALVITGFAEHAILEHLVGVRIVRKPFRRDVMLQAVRAVLAEADEEKSDSASFGKRSKTFFSQ